MPDTNPEREIPELFELLLRVYMKAKLADEGDSPAPPPTKELFDQLPTEIEQRATSLAINHFVEFARTFLLEHPPQLYLTGVQGFGIELALAGAVRLIPALYAEGGGTMEPSNDTPVTREGESRLVPGLDVNIT